jgi:hypothetical protein
MIIVEIPDNNHSERKYTINFLLGEMLGIEHEIRIKNEENNYSLGISNFKLIFKDCFFNDHIEPLSYINSKSLPGTIQFFKNDFLSEPDIPVIFGTGELGITEDQIFCGIDIFASSFFMLCRWEEYVNPVRDNHDRFPGDGSIAYRNHFLQRPVVNEYVELLWNLLLKAGYTGIRRQRSFNIVPTHDVDLISFPKSPRMLYRDIRAKRFKKFSWDLYRMFIHDTTDTFSTLMSTSEKTGVQSRFYFMASDSSIAYDTPHYLKSIRFHRLLAEIRSRGHLIGFHPGYTTYNNGNRWQEERTLLENALNEKVFEGRQHYLRFDVSKTLSIWNDNEMKIDSTMGYANQEGFRCGTGDIFPIFDFISRRQLLLTERPLIIMDSSIREYQKFTLQEMVNIMHHYISIGRKYKMPITLLFHNSSLESKIDGSMMYKAIFSN